MEREELLFKLEENVPQIEGKDIWIWGSGNTAKLYQEGLKRINKLNICGYCDNDSKKWGKFLGGKKIVSPEQLKKYKNICVLLCTQQDMVVSIVSQQLENMKIEWHCLDEVIFKLYKEEIIECYDLLDSQVSKDIYAHIIECRMNNTMPADSYIVENTYFALRQFKAYGNETFVDCGAFVGDTIEQYIWRKYAMFHKIIAFEPDRRNFNAMEHRIRRLKKEWNLKEDQFELNCCAVGMENGNILIQENSNMGSSIVKDYVDMKDGKNVTNVKMVALDNFLKEPYSFLKADVEGFEYNVIMGAQNSIKKHKPLLAICIYHNAADLFGVQLLIHHLSSDYKFAIRHHSITFDETVLYAYV